MQSGGTSGVYATDKAAKVADKYNMFAAWHKKIKKKTYAAYAQFFIIKANCSSNLSSAMKLSASQLFLWVYLRERERERERGFRGGDRALCVIQFRWFFLFFFFDCE